MNSKIKKAFAGALALAAAAGGASVQLGGGLMPETGITAYAEEQWVGWDIRDFPPAPGPYFTKDGVTYHGVIDQSRGVLLGGTFTTDLGSFTSIVVDASSCNISGAGWHSGVPAAVWEGNASEVSLPGRINGIRSIEFVIDTSKPATATYAQVGGDYDPQFDGDTAASVWKVTVTPGSDAITSLSVKVNGDKEPNNKLPETAQLSGMSEVVFGVVVNAEHSAVTSIAALVNGKAVVTTAE